MKNVYLFILLLLVNLYSCKTVKPVAGSKPDAITPQVNLSESASKAVNFSDQETWLLGYFNKGRLTSYPYSTWYITGFDDYQFNTDAINKLLEISKESLTIKIVMGTWCPDSRREVPRFMRVIDVWQFPDTKVTFIGVDNAKLSPVGEYNNLDIQRVPTFIIYKNNIEVGRIIENPTTSLEQDMVNILTGMKNIK
jgi:thiol-disulfide isomerase/thioredoxin